MSEPFIFCCSRCGEIFESDKQRYVCTKCADTIRKSAKREHIVKHDGLPDIGTSEQVRKQRKKAESSEDAIKKIVRLADKQHMSYGEYVAEAEYKNVVRRSKSIV